MKKKPPHKHIWDHKNRKCRICGKSLDKAIDEIHKAAVKACNDPKVIERGEELDRQMRNISWEDLNRPFDI